MSGDTRTSTSERLLDRRKRLLGPAYRLFFDQPLHLVRGDGVWLYDEDDRPYLDVYNNVAHVGHCHPHVVDALRKQAETLNTHTRYLHETAVEYAARLMEEFPDELDVCMYCCTGSEANELAVRIARAYAGGEGVIVTEHAYHGNTGTLSQLSTTHTYVQRGPEVQTCTAPNSFGGPYRSGDAHLGRKYTAFVEDALRELRTHGIQPAAIFLDTFFSTDGILTAPPDYFHRVVELVRNSGGLFIADEVQSGFGRTGDHMWGFQRYDIVPDIVTLGKPMGNGHPLAAVIVKRHIVERFAEHARYFNTFGGNPVSCAVGMAVLDVMERENLQQNAFVVGGYLKEELGKLQSKHELIGDIRGHGLFIGVELVLNRETLEPASGEAAAIVNDLRNRGVLIGTTGPDENVLKLRPPMVFNRENARQLVDALDAALMEV